MLEFVSRREVYYRPCFTIVGNQNIRGRGFKWKSLIMEMEWFPDIRSHIHEVPFARGCCMAVLKDTFDKIGKFDSGIQIWGVEDLEICLRAWLLRYRVLCEPSIRVGHMFRDRHPYEVQWTHVLYNLIRLAFSHFKPERLAKFLNAISQLPNFDAACSNIFESDILNRRKDLFSRRERSDDWFFDRFPMNDY